MPAAMNRRRVNNFTYVSPCVKYMIFLLNFLFWLFGGLLVAAGTFAFYEKWNTMGSIKLNTFSDVILNISLVLILAGQIIFVVSFAGCIGALRENTSLLKFLPFKDIAAQIAKRVANIYISNETTLQKLKNTNSENKLIEKPKHIRNEVIFKQRDSFFKEQRYTTQLQTNIIARNTDIEKKLLKNSTCNNDEIIFKQLDCYDEVLNFQTLSPLYTNNLKPMDVIQLDFYTRCVLINRDQIFNLMYATIEQGNNSIWRLNRETRLSASSKAHQIKTRRNKHEELAERFVKEKKIFGKGLKYVDYGIRMEDFASKKYSEVHCVQVIKCGLIVHQSQPWMCASPDGLVVHSNNKVKKLLEIKCPFTCKDTLLIDEDNGKIRVPYLEYDKENNTINLKQNHNYYTQCQIQMYCTGLEECDLFVYTKQDCITVLVRRDNLFLENLVKKMEYFYFNYYLPKLTKVHV